MANSDNWSVILTLNHGDLPFGDFGYFSQPFSGTPEEVKEAGLWIPDRCKLLPPKLCSAYRLSPIYLAFNSKEGTKYGQSHFLPFIKSKLIFYGEVKQIPIKIGDIRLDYTLIGRAIGYLTANKDW